MDGNIPDGYLPEKNLPDLLHTLPELHYPEQINAAVEMVDRHVREGHGERTAITFEDQDITYQELQERTDTFGNALRNLGVEPGDRVFVRFPNRPEYVVVCLAAQKIGAIPLPSMKLMQAREIKYVLEDSKSTLGVVEADLLPEFLEAAEKIEYPENLVVAGEPDDEADHHRYSDLMDESSADLTVHETARDDLALMAYTSGTTGQPKGTVHTHRQLLATCDGYAKYCLDPGPEDVFSGNPPIAFAYGYGIFVSFPLRYGARSVLIEDASPADLLSAVDEHGVTVMGSVPTAYNQLLAEYEDLEAEFDLSSLRLLTSGGEVLPVQTYQAVNEQFGVEITDGMGTTELLHIFISHRVDDEFDPTATGFPVPGYECKVIDPETGEEVPRGEPGLLVVRGPTGIQYWNRPQAQAEAVRDGWNVTGDVFVHREDGRFVYKSRRDDIIITAGHTVPGPEVEVVLEERDEVYEAAVVSSPGEERNEIVKAFVVLTEEVTPSEDLAADLQDYVKNQIAPYKYPREIEFLDTLPKTETGKKRRASLRDREYE